MGARETFLDLAARGIRLVAQGDRLVVTPASLLTDEDRGAIRRYRDELLGLLAEGVSATPDPSKGATDPRAPSDRTCAACAHRTGAGTCGRPVEAGLADRFAIRWPPAGHASVCKAFERQPPVPDPGTQPPELPRHPYEAERRAWTPATEPELQRMAAVHARAVEFGLDAQQADHVADVQHWGRRTGDDRRLCLECRSLRAGASSRWWCAARHLPLPQQLVVEPHRCRAFFDLEAQHD